MIKPYTGKGWFLNAKGERIECEYTEKDKMIQAVCDICGDCVCDEDGDGGSLFSEEGEANDMAQDYDWIVLGKHHICSKCRDCGHHKDGKCANTPGACCVQVWRKVLEETK